MKLIIDINDRLYNDIRNCADVQIASHEAIKNGIPYEERHGEWIEENSETGALGIKYTWFKCNQCNWSNSLVIPKNFCPNCGADMRVKNELNDELNELEEGENDS